MGHSRPLFLYLILFFKQNGPFPASFCLFLFFSRHNFNTNWKKHRWCAWDSNLGPKDGGRRQNHGAMEATPEFTSLQKEGKQMFYIKIRNGLHMNHTPLVSEATALPTEPNHCPIINFFFLSTVDLDRLSFEATYLLL